MTRQSHRRRLAGALLLGCSLVPVAEASLSTATLVASAASPSCISWRISGICYWLKCGWGGCRIRTSVRVSHFIPQAVVSAYHARVKTRGGKCHWSAGRPAGLKMP